MAFVRIVLVYDVQNRTADANSAKQRECQHLLIRSLQLFKLAASYSFFPRSERNQIPIKDVDKPPNDSISSTC